MFSHLQSLVYVLVLKVNIGPVGWPRSLQHIVKGKNFNSNALSDDFFLKPQFQLLPSSATLGACDL